MTKFSEQDRTFHRELIWKNALDLFENRKGMTHLSIIRSQKKFINTFHLPPSKNKYKSVQILNNYLMNPNKLIAEQVFYNTMKKKIKL